MSEVRDAVERFLADHPEAEEALEELLTVDETHDTWEFGAIGIDSGTFGEIVSRGIVEKVDGAYRVREPETVAAVLAGEDPSSSVVESLEFSWRPSLDVRAVGGLLGALFVLLVMRVVQYPAIRREEHLVSPANDPYHYRYMMNELLTISQDPWTTEVIADLPARASSRRPFAHAANWWVAAFLGGDTWAAEMVAGWLPVVATVVLGVVVYGIAVVVTGDVRVGLASVFLLALTPVHAVYSGFGFLEHRLHQYLWLGVTLWCLSWLAVASDRHREALLGLYRSPWTWLAVVGLMPGLAFSILAWGGSVMYLIPLAGYVGLRVVHDVREGVSPLLANGPVIVGIGLGALLTGGLHVRWAWHDVYVLYIPVVVFVGCISVVGLGEVWRRQGWPEWGLLGVQVLGVVGGLALFRRQFPEVWEPLIDRSGDLFFRDSTAIESAGLFSEQFDLLIGPILQVGVHFIIAVGIMVWAARIVWKGYSPRWLVLCVYGGVWLVFAAFQARFAAQLSIILAVFGGFGLVWFLSWVELARKPLPLREEDDGPSLRLPSSAHAGVYLVGMIIVIGGIGMAFVPLLGADVTYSDEQYEAMQAIAVHAEEPNELEAFVLSEWGENRMYNHLVFGEGDTYGYASRNYVAFLQTDAEQVYDDYGGSVGYVVMDEAENELEDGSVAGVVGNRSGETLPQSGQLQALYLADDVQAFAVVPGATITVNSSVAEEVVEETITVGGQEYTYEHAVQQGSNRSQVSVAYPGDYTFAGEEVTVTPSDVVNGTEIDLE